MAERGGSSRRWLFGISLFVLVVASVAAMTLRRAPQVAAAAPPPPIVPAVTESCPAIDPPPAEPSKNVPTLVEAAAAKVQRREQALARELSKMWTRNPDELVSVIDGASRTEPKSPSVTLLLAIAHAETNGKVLDVSEAGAVGLAQATPIACRQEKFEGALFVTDDYLIGSRAYITKKPLGDADTIATLVVDKDDAKTRRRAKRLLESAKELRREGIDELDLLEPFAKTHYFASIKAADQHNLATLRHLGKLLDHGSRRELRSFRNDVRREYRALKATQLAAWKRYQNDLAAERDRVLEEHYGKAASIIKKEMPYEAGEYLGEHLDERFSASKMAAFLVRHLERKAEEARKLASSDASDDDVEAMTAALYNGGSHNVKRMLAGLIRSLPETQQYMKKVPATRRRLDIAAARVEPPVRETR